MPSIRFKEFGYYNGNHSNIAPVDVDEAFAAYAVGMGVAEAIVEVAEAQKKGAKK